jgi:signal transduction histidine kinase
MWAPPHWRPAGPWATLDVMYIVLLLVVAGTAVYCCLMPAWRRPLNSWLPGISREWLRKTGLLLALLVLAACAVALLTNSNPWPATVVVPATVWLIVCAPPSVRRLAPIAIAGLGALGVLITLVTEDGDGGPLGTSTAAASAVPSQRALTGGALPRAGSVATQMQSWHIALLLESAAFLAAGLWLMWRAGSPAAGPRRQPRWGVLLLPPAVAALAVLISQQPDKSTELTVVALASVALLIAVMLPAVSADLAAAAVLALGLFSLLKVVTPPRVPSGAEVAAPGGVPHLVLFTPADRPLITLAAVECAAILALGAWLVPRTIGVHARVLLGREADAELAGRVEQLTQTRADAVDTAAAELRRVERDLHDGAQARLVALGMSLRAAERLIPTSPQAAIALVAEARESSSKALTELRDLVRGVYPPVLADRGLADAVRALALDTPVRTETEIDLPGRLDPPVESACYFAIAEALTNAVKHSGARLVQIRMRYSGRTAPGMLRIEVTDNGDGGADPAKGSGLAGVERRLATFDGILAVSSPLGGPTIIVMEIPCALSSRRTSSC